MIILEYNSLSPVYSSKGIPIKDSKYLFDTNAMEASVTIVLPDNISLTLSPVLKEVIKLYLPLTGILNKAFKFPNLDSSNSVYALSNLDSM